MSRAFLIVLFCAGLAACGGKSGDGSAGGGSSAVPTGGLDPTNLAAELVPPENGKLPADLLPPS